MVNALDSTMLVQQHSLNSAGFPEHQRRGTHAAAHRLLTPATCDMNSKNFLVFDINKEFRLSTLVKPGFARGNGTRSQDMRQVENPKKNPHGTPLGNSQL